MGHVLCKWSKGPIAGAINGRGGRPSLLGTWQKSDAPALQAGFKPERYRSFSTNFRGRSSTLERSPRTRLIRVGFPAIPPISASWAWLSRRQFERTATATALNPDGVSSTMPTTAAEPPARDNQQRITLLRGTRPMHRGQPHKLLQIGVTPIPATTSRRNAFIELVGFSNG